MLCLRIFLASILVVRLAAQSPGDGYSREQLLPLTKYRQQHRRTIDGRLCGWTGGLMGRIAVLSQFTPTVCPRKFFSAIGGMRHP